jgi:hypothetical protein
MTHEKNRTTVETKMRHTKSKDSQDITPSYPTTTSAFLDTGSTALNVLLAIVTLPIQGLAILLLSRAIQQVVFCIDEVYEATGRRSRSKFVGFPWARIAFGVILLAVYHMGLFKLTVKSWKALRRSQENVG